MYMKTLRTILLALWLSVLAAAVGWNPVHAQSTGQQTAQEPTVMYAEIPNHTNLHVRQTCKGSTYIAMYKMHHSGKYGFYLLTQDPDKYPLAQQELLAKFPNASKIEFKSLSQVNEIFKALDE